MPLVSRTRATLRSAEFGFFGVVVYTRVHTPRRWGEPFSAGVLVFSTLSSRPLRTSWLIVGMGGLDLLPALGRAVDGALLCRVPVLPGPYPNPAVDPHRSPRSGVSPSPGPAGESNRIGRPPRLGATTYRQAHREREQAQGTLGTADHDTRVPETGQSRVPHGSASGVEPCPPGYAAGQRRPRPWCSRGGAPGAGRWWRDCSGSGAPAPRRRADTPEVRGCRTPALRSVPGRPPSATGGS